MRRYSSQRDEFYPAKQIRVRRTSRSKCGCPKSPNDPKHVASPCRCGCLKLHLRDRFELGDFLLDGGEPGNFVLGESGQANIMAGGLKFLQHSDEAVFVDLGQFGEEIVREHVRKFCLFARVILEVDRDLLAAEQQRGFEAPVAACDEAALSLFAR